MEWLVLRLNEKYPGQQHWLQKNTYDCGGIKMYPLKFTSIKNNPQLEGFSSWLRDITYSTATGTELKMQILMPWGASLPENAEKRWPCIVFVQGSGWQFPDVTYELPQLGSVSREGYVVATVTHRSALDGNKAPAFLEDVKTAIRFLRKNAAEYHVDPERVGMWGTSSGGNTALLVGLTAEDSAYKTAEYAEYSDAVKTVVDCFGPSDLLAMAGQKASEGNVSDENMSFLYDFLGENQEEQLKRAALIDPILKIVPGKKYPPFMILHGDSDDIVPYSQSEKIAKSLCENDVHTELVRVEGASHEGSFWSNQLLSLIEDFFRRTL